MKEIKRYSIKPNCELIKYRSGKYIKFSELDFGYDANIERLQRYDLILVKNRPFVRKSKSGELILYDDYNINFRLGYLLDVQNYDIAKAELLKISSRVKRFSIFKILMPQKFYARVLNDLIFTKRLIDNITFIKTKSLIDEFHQMYDYCDEIHSYLEDV